MATAGLAVQAAPALADTPSSAAAAFVADINALRAAHGAPALSVNPALVSEAMAWTQRMVAAGSISHNPNLAAYAPSNWQKLGENVGVGPNEPVLQQAFTNSPHHYENMIDPAFRQIGVAVVVTPAGQMFVTEDYMQPMGQVVTQSAPAPVYHAPAPAAAPAPAPGPARPAYHPAPAPAPAPVTPHAAPAAAPAPVPHVATPGPAPAAPPAATVSAARAVAPTSLPVSVAHPPVKRSAGTGHRSTKAPAHSRPARPKTHPSTSSAPATIPVVAAAGNGGLAVAATLAPLTAVPWALRRRRRR
ncbi:MAG TPA: CAP domain-containing protein [Acidimicrobiales bacterium]|nr:CAP domain-containing protein [Acidimicrobiales bacterium]